MAARSVNMEVVDTGGIVQALSSASWVYQVADGEGIMAALEARIEIEPTVAFDQF